MNISNLVYQGSYFYITEEILPNRKTPIYNIINNNLVIGQIRWYGPWRKFCFYPGSNTVWDDKCLQDVLKIINDYNSNWKQTKKS